MIRRERHTNPRATDDLAGTVLITVDSLRADTLGSLVAAGHAPAFGSLRERGTVFETAFAHGNWTPFSFPSILAARPVFDASPSIGLPDSPALAEVLSRAGVTTAGINAANGFLTEHWGYDRGFGEFDALLGDEPAVYSKYLSAHPTVQGWVQLLGTGVRRAADRVRIEGGGDRTNGSRDDARAGAVGARARAFIENVNEPFFLWLHYMDAHTPYLPAPRHVAAVTGDRIGVLRTLRAHAHTGLGLEVDSGTLRRLRQLYRAAVRGIDESVAGVLDALSERGLRGRTCVIVAGDHGEEFLEHGHLAHYPKLYEELIHVPLIVDHPAETGTPNRVERPVGLERVAPTICAAMGVEAPTGFEGEALPGIANGSDDEPTTDEKPIVSVAVRGNAITQQPIPRRLDEGELLVSARTDEWTYIHHTESGRRELYERATDPEERTNVYGQYEGTEETRRLHEAIEAHVARIGGTDERGEQAPPAGVATRLKALGYR